MPGADSVPVPSPGAAMTMTGFLKPVPSAALTAMHEADQQHGIDPLAFPPAAGPPHPGDGPPLQFEAVDWRQQRAAPELVREDTESRPAKPTPKPKAAKPTPRLDAARALLEEIRRA
jgi:hypothetical protein